MTIHTLIATQRRQLADQLEGLGHAEWDTATLCDGWTVRHVTAHLLMPFRYSTARYAFGMVRARGDFNRFADRVARRDATLPTQALVAQLRANAENPWTPPGAGPEAPLTDLVMHTLDIVRPLDLASGLDPEAVLVALDHLVTPQGLRFFGIDLRGVCLRASDLAWAHGDGEIATGPAEDLVLALGARRTALDLDGPAARRVLQTTS